MAMLSQALEKRGKSELRQRNHVLGNAKEELGNAQAMTSLETQRQSQEQLRDATAQRSTAMAGRTPAVIGSAKAWSRKDLQRHSTAKLCDGIAEGCLAEA